MVDVGAVVDVSVDVNAGGCEEGEGVLVLVVMAGRVSETQSSRHSPCSCQSQSTTKSGTTRKKKGEGELKKKGGELVVGYKKCHQKIIGVCVNLHNTIIQDKEVFSLQCRSTCSNDSSWL